MKKILPVNLTALVLTHTLPLVLALALATCRPSSRIPPGEDPHIPGPDNPRTISIAWLKSLYNGAPIRIKGEYHISGAVVSDDRQGNFYQTLVLDDGTAGIEIRLDMEQIFKTFMIHTRVNVRCNGLWLGSYGGTLQLGTEPYGEYQTQPLSEALITQHLTPDNEFYGEIIPRTLTIKDISPAHISTYAAFENVRFIDEEQNHTWAQTEADTNRHLTDLNGDTLIVRTSRHARFASWPLPHGTGRIEGILNLFNNQYQLTVCDSQKFTQQATR